MAERVYGIRELDGKVIGISEIPMDFDLRKSDEWRCICPQCKVPLIPKKGKIREHHFAHDADDNRCSIAHANQTAVHIMAKEIIEEARMFYAPPIKVAWKEVMRPTHDLPAALLDVVPVYTPFEGGMIECTQMNAESRLSGIIPDLVATTDQRECLIEIFVTHRVTEDKIAATKKLKLSMIEIDLSDYRDKEISRDELREILLTPNDRSVWLYNSKKSSYLEDAFEYYSAYTKGLRRFKGQKTISTASRPTRADANEYLFKQRIYDDFWLELEEKKEKEKQKRWEAEQRRKQEEGKRALKAYLENSRNQNKEVALKPEEEQL